MGIRLKRKEESAGTWVSVPKARTDRKLTPNLISGLIEGNGGDSEDRSKQHRIQTAPKIGDPARSKAKKTEEPHLRLTVE